MIDLYIPDHVIQRHIIGVLMTRRVARFRDMIPPKTDTNLYSYHLKILQKKQLIEKTADGYTLSRNGLVYADNANVLTAKLSAQPKVITMSVVQNSDGDVLLFQRKRQPFIGTWSLPYGKVHTDDISVLGAAQREAREKLGLDQPPMTHAGDCYIRITDQDEVVMSTLAHVFYFETDDIQPHERLQWVRPHKLAGYDLAPAVERIITRTFFRDPFFFEEYEEPMESGART